MQTLIGTLINGLALGMAYALIAVGYSMVFGVLRLINFSHSAVYAFGAYMVYFFVSLNFGLLPAVIVAVVLSGLLGIDADEDGRVCRPLVPASWRAFRVEGVCHAGQRWTIEYRNGTALVGSAGRQCRQPVAAAE